MGGITDTELTRQLRNGNVEAFDQLYWRYHSAVYANVLKLVKDHSIAEDILQEVFLTLWEKRVSLQEEKSLAGWLFTTSFHKAVDALRRSVKEASVIRLLPSFPFEQNKEFEWPSELPYEVLDEAVKRLSIQKQKVFRLCKLQGKTYEEAANELQISKHTVKEYLSDAVRFIKTYLQNHPQVALTSFRLSLLVILSSFL